MTPLDPAAVARGWQYRLGEIEDVVARDTSPSLSTGPISKQNLAHGCGPPAISPVVSSRKVATPQNLPVLGCVDPVSV